MLSVQLPLSLDGLYDSTARREGHVKPPCTRAGCIGGKAARRSGKTECEAVLCRYHLLGELARRPTKEAERAMLSRLRGEWVDTCALDIVDDNPNGIDDELHANIMGIEPHRVTQISAETTARLRRWLDEEAK